MKETEQGKQSFMERLAIFILDKLVEDDLSLDRAWRLYDRASGVDGV